MHCVDVDLRLPFSEKSGINGAAKLSTNKTTKENY